MPRDPTAARKRLDGGSPAGSSPDGSSPTGTGVSRRRLLSGIATGLTAVSAGCSGGSATPSPNPMAGGDEFSDRPIEILHGWTSGDGAGAIRSVERMFRARHPDVGVDFHPVGGTGNDNLISAVDRRLTNGNPPSSFAAWPGPNLAQYEGQLRDVTDIWDANGFDESMHWSAGEYARWNGGIRAIPIGSHRLNNLFLNVDVVERAGVDPESLTSMTALESALSTVDQRTDAVPLAHAMQAPWTNLQLVVWVLVSQAGTAAYERFISGEGGRSVVLEALKTARRLLTTYVNDDTSTISFTEANRKLIRGEAAMIAQGSWVYGMYRNADSLAFESDWQCVPFPGTAGIYGFHLDAFVFPTDNPIPEKTDVWAAFVGQPDPQIAFGNRKGSVPLHQNIDPSRLAAFPRRIWQNLTESDTLVPTFAHGLAVGPGKLAGCKAAISEHFMGPFDVERTADALLDVLK